MRFLVHEPPVRQPRRCPAATRQTEHLAPNRWFGSSIWSSIRHAGLRLKNSSSRLRHLIIHSSNRKQRNDIWRFGEGNSNEEKASGGHNDRSDWGSGTHAGGMSVVDDAQRQVTERPHAPGPGLPRVITPSAHRLTGTPIRGTRTIAKSKGSVRTRLDGRRGTPTFPRARETCPMPGTSCRTYNWLSSTLGNSAITR